jgi:hypothetical protein
MSGILKIVVAVFRFILEALLDLLCFCMLIVAVAAFWRVPFWPQELKFTSRNKYRGSCLVAFGSSMCDIVTLPILCITMCSWRLLTVLSVLNAECSVSDDYNIELRGHVWVQLGMLLLDIPCLLMLCVTTVAFWRLPYLVMDIKKEAERSDFALCGDAGRHNSHHRQIIVYHFVNALFDLLCLPMGLIVLVTGYRVQYVYAAFTDEANDVVKRKLWLVKECGLVLLDLPFFLVALLVGLTAWRAKPLYDDWRKALDADDFWLMRLLPLLHFVLTLRDLICLVLFVPVLAFVYRGVLAVKRIADAVQPWADTRPVVTATSIEITKPTARNTGIDIRVRGTKPADLVLPDTTVKLYVRNKSFWHDLSNVVGGGKVTVAQAMMPFSLTPRFVKPAELLEEGSTDVDFVIEFSVSTPTATIVRWCKKLEHCSSPWLQIEYGSHTGTIVNLDINFREMHAALAAEGDAAEAGAGGVYQAKPMEEITVADHHRENGDPREGSRLCDVAWKVILMQFLFLLLDMIALVFFVLLHLFPWRIYRVYSMAGAGNERHGALKVLALAEQAQRHMAGTLPMLTDAVAVIDMKAEVRREGINVSTPDEVQHFGNAVQKLVAALDKAGAREQSHAIAAMHRRSTDFVNAYKETLQAQFASASGADNNAGLDMFRRGDVPDGNGDDDDDDDDWERTTWATKHAAADNSAPNTPMLNATKDLQANLQSDMFSVPASSTIFETAEQNQAYFNGLIEMGFTPQAVAQAMVGGGDPVEKLLAQQRDNAVPPEAIAKFHVSFGTVAAPQIGTTPAKVMPPAVLRDHADLVRKDAAVAAAIVEAAEEAFAATRWCGGKDGWGGFRSVVYREVSQLMYDFAAILAFVIVFCTLYRTYPLLSTVFREGNVRKACLRNLSEVAIDLLYLFKFAAVLLGIRGAFTMPADLVAYLIRKPSFAVSRQVIDHHLTLLAADLLHMLSLLFAWDAVRLVLATVCFGVFAPGVMLEGALSAWEEDADGNVTTGDGNMCRAAFLLLVAVAWMFGLPFLIAYWLGGVSPAAATATYYGVMLFMCCIGTGAALCRRDRRVTALRRNIVRYVRPSWHNMSVYLSIVLDGIQLLAVAVALTGHGVFGDHGIGERMRDAADYAFLVFGGGWVAHGVPFGVYFSIVVVLLHFVLAAMPVVTGHMLHWRSATHVTSSPIWISAMQLLGQVLLLTVSRNFAVLLTCDAEGALVYNSAVRCWEGEHRALSIVAMIFYVYYLPSALMRNATYDESSCRGLDVIYPQLYRMLVNGGVAVATVVSVVAYDSPTAGFVMLLLAALWGVCVTAFYGPLLNAEEGTCCSVRSVAWWRGSMYAFVLVATAVVLGCEAGGVAGPWPLGLLGGVLVLVVLVAFGRGAQMRREQSLEQDTIDETRRELLQLEETLHGADAMTHRWAYQASPWRAKVRGATRASVLALAATQLEAHTHLLAKSVVFFMARDRWAADCAKVVSACDKDRDIDVDHELSARGFWDRVLCCDCGCCSHNDGRSDDEDPKEMEEEAKLELLQRIVATLQNATRDHATHPM